MECVKNNGSTDDATKSILSSWCIVCTIVACVITGVTGEMAMGMTNVTHVLIALLLACVTLSISSGMIYFV